MTAAEYKTSKARIFTQLPSAPQTPKSRLLFFAGRMTGYVTAKKEKQAFLNIKNVETNDLISIKKYFLEI